MPTDPPANNEGRPDLPGTAPRASHGVDPQAEQERLVSVSETRADVYGMQADAARSLAQFLGRTEEERRQLELLRADLLELQLPHYALLDLTSMIRRGASLEHLLQRVLEQAVRIFEASKSSILIPDETGQALRVAAALQQGEKVRDEFTLGLAEGVAGQVFTTGEPQVIDDTSTSSLFKPGQGGPHPPRYLVAILLAAEGEKLGVLCLERPLGLPASPDKIEQLTAFASHAAVQLRNIHSYERLLKQVQELSVLCEISRELSSSLEHDALLQKIVDSAVTLLDCGMSSLMLFEDDKQSLRIRHAVGLPQEVVEQAVVRPGEGVSGWVAERGTPLLIEDISRDDRFQSRRDAKPGKYTTKSLLSVPLLIGTEVVGVLNVNNKVNNAVFTEHDLTNLTMLASQAAVSIENARLYETLQRLAVTDPLTKLFRRNYFEEQLEMELGRCRRYDRPLSLMMVDIDHFKKVNDTYGHPVGDQVLQGLAGLLRRYGRKDDVIARYGGEEFVVYLVETDPEGAQVAAERVRQAAEVQEFPLANGKHINLTVSVGTASFPAHGETGEVLVQRADLALYAAKHGGRNRVCSYYDGLEMPTGGVESDR